MSGRDLPADFVTVVEALKARIRETQLRAALAVNRELLGLYWNIGRAISERVEAEAWGTRVVEQLADELQRSFPGIGGFSRANVYRMRAFYLAYPPLGPASGEATELVAQAVRQFSKVFARTARRAGILAGRAGTRGDARGTSAGCRSARGERAVDGNHRAWGAHGAAA